MEPAPLSTTPDVVADAVVRALQKGTTDVWVPRSLGLLARVMRLVPRFLWRLAPR
jgi:hypothetical protein